MSDDRPLTFVVRRMEDGAVLDRFREDELMTYGTQKTWQEACAWAYLAISADKKARAPA